MWDAPLLRLLVEPTDGNGLDMASQVEIDKVITIRRIGELERAQMIQVGRSLLVFLGLAG